MLLRPQPPARRNDSINSLQLASHPSPLDPPPSRCLVPQHAHLGLCHPLHADLLCVTQLLELMAMGQLRGKGSSIILLFLEGPCDGRLCAAAVPFAAARLPSGTDNDSVFALNSILFVSPLFTQQRGRESRDGRRGTWTLILVLRIADVQYSTSTFPSLSDSASLGECLVLVAGLARVSCPRFVFFVHCPMLCAFFFASTVTHEQLRGR